MYRLKHVPTGMYYQPHKYRGSNISKRGKVYQTKTHGLSTAFKSKSKTFSVYVEKNSRTHKETKDILVFVECTYSHHQIICETNTCDWVIEEI